MEIAAGISFSATPYLARPTVQSFANANLQRPKTLSGYNPRQPRLVESETHTTGNYLDAVECLARESPSAGLVARPCPRKLLSGQSDARRHHRCGGRCSRTVSQRAKESFPPLRNRTQRCCARLSDDGCHVVSSSARSYSSTVDGSDGPVGDGRVLSGSTTVPTFLVSQLVKDCVSGSWIPVSGLAGKAGRLMKAVKVFNVWNTFIFAVTSFRLNSFR